MTGIRGPSSHMTLPQNPSNNKCFSMALSPRGKFSRSINVITSFPNFRYQSTQKNYAFKYFVKGKQKISPAESKWNSGILSFGIKQIHAVWLAPARAANSELVLNDFANTWISRNSVNNFYSFFASLLSLLFQVAVTVTGFSEEADT